MLSGYFSIDKEFKAQRVLRLWRQVFFYSLVIFLCYHFYGATTGADWVKALLPISARNYWFASVYMGFVLLLPFAGMLVVRLTKKQYQYLLFILTIFFSVNHMIFRVDTYGIFSGRELSWFCYLALLAGYIKLHTRQDKKYFLYGLCVYITSSLMALASVYLSVKMHQEDIGYFLNYNSPLALISTCALFLCVKNMPWRESKLDAVILKVASAAFGVYLLHDNYLIRYLVWDFFHASKVARTHFAVIYAVAIAVVVYLVCTALELLRQLVFSKLKMLYQDTLLYRKEQALCESLDRVIAGK